MVQLSIFWECLPCKGIGPNRSGWHHKEDKGGWDHSLIALGQGLGYENAGRMGIARGNILETKI